MALFLVVDNEEHLRILQILKVGLEDEPCISMSVQKNWNFMCFNLF